MDKKKTTDCTEQNTPLTSSEYAKLIQKELSNKEPITIFIKPDLLFLIATLVGKSLSLEFLNLNLKRALIQWILDISKAIAPSSLGASVSLQQLYDTYHKEFDGAKIKPDTDA